MLVLTRQPGGGITLKLEDGRRIKIKVVAVDSCQRGRIGIDAAKTINVLRDEVTDTSLPKDPHVDIDNCPAELVDLHDIWISTSERAVKLRTGGYDVAAREVNGVADDIERVYFGMKARFKNAPESDNNDERGEGGETSEGMLRLAGEGRAKGAKVGADSHRSTRNALRTADTDSHSQATSHNSVGRGQTPKVSAPTKDQ